MGFIADIYPVEMTTPLLTDKYHFTTAYAYWREGRADNEATFYMFGRKEAFGGGYSVTGGLEGVIDIVKRWQEHGFIESDFEYLRAQKTPSGKRVFSEEFIDYLKTVEFKLKIDAAPEGTVFFPQEPVMRVTGPLFQVKVLESVALGIINGHSGYVTQAARQTAVLEEELENGSPKGSASVQGLRRASIGAALEASRSLGLGGYTSTSTGTAAKEFAQVFAGTMDHAWVMTHEKELGKHTLKELYAMETAGETEKLQAALRADAFRSFAMAFPENGIFLLDTYDPVQGLENAITVIKEMRELGIPHNYGVRFDSGDLVAYSKIALRRFAEEGFVKGLDPKDVKNMSDAALLKLSGNCEYFVAPADGIDEYTGGDMRKAGGFFRSFGVGTAGAHVPPLGLVYKATEVMMAANDEAPTKVMKVASNAPVKSSNPGIINSRRYYNQQGQLAHVTIYDERQGFDPSRKVVNLRDFKDARELKEAWKTEDILVPVFDRNGTYVYQEPPKVETFPGSGKMTTNLAIIAQKIKDQLKTLPEDVRRVVRTREELLKRKLYSAFMQAKSSGEERLELDIGAVLADMPKEVGHVPVYLDRLLFEQRMACEKRHLAHANSSGVGEYKERFEGGNVDKKPAAVKRPKRKLG